MEDTKLSTCQPHSLQFFCLGVQVLHRATRAVGASRVCARGEATSCRWRPSSTSSTRRLPKMRSLSSALASGPRTELG
eukprot:5886992-Amphidinium_carterae.1